MCLDVVGSLIGCLVALLNVLVRGVVNVPVREKLLTWLFGKQEKVMVLIPGNTVESVSIVELPEGGVAVG